MAILISRSKSKKSHHTSSNRRTKSILESLCSQKSWRIIRSPQFRITTWTKDKHTGWLSTSIFPANQQDLVESLRGVHLTQGRPLTKTMTPIWLTMMMTLMMNTLRMPMNMKTSYLTHSIMTQLINFSKTFSRRRDMPVGLNHLAPGILTYLAEIASTRAGDLALSMETIGFTCKDCQETQLIPLKVFSRLLGV